ncbi:unnamed protein product [Trichogramma brassicae]|uniref:Major facilitator superfamily (MFS) profile domain-containing protein n=1 Tax=Trichogramma brassicae TaxID=86971 RepID=A0A6H5HY94_9HYME|nr:unnamed protein product [Trichogramma brassicae]
MGTLGPWHIVIAVALSLVKFPVAWHQLGIVFLAPPGNFTCASPTPADNTSSRLNQCLVDVGGGHMEKCSQFNYDRSIFDKTIISETTDDCDTFAIGNRISHCILSLVRTFLVFKFISAVATGGTMLISFVLLMEIVGPKWRSSLSVLFHLPFLLGFLMNPLVAYLTRTWTGFQMAVSIPPIFLLSYYWIVPESPRWLLAVGRREEATTILTKAAEKNRIPLSKVTAAIESHKSQEKLIDEPEKKYNFTHLFLTPNMRLKTICVCVNWFVCGLCFFGLAQYIGRLNGNIFVNTAISAAVEFPGTLIILFLISRVSRLKILIGGNLVSGITLILIMIFDDPKVQVGLACIGIAAMSISFPTVYLYSSEVFPTVVRNVGVGAGSIAARIGSMIAPFIATMNIVYPWLPPLIFGIGPIVGAGLCFLLPETMNFELPETIEDGENFGKYVH